MFFLKEIVVVSLLNYGYIYWSHMIERISVFSDNILIKNSMNVIRHLKLRHTRQQDIYTVYHIIGWFIHKSVSGVRGGAFGWGTALQAGRSQFQFPVVLLEFFIDIILPAALWPWGWLSFWQKWEPGVFPRGKSGHLCEERGMYRVLLGIPEGRRPLGRPRRRWVDNIRMDL